MNLFLTFILSLMIGINSIILGNPPIKLSSLASYQMKVADKKLENQAAPCIIVVFGGTGDLTARKLFPAIYNLAHEDNLSAHTAIVGVAFDNHTDSTYRKRMSEAFDQFDKTHVKDVDFWNQFETKIFYNQAEFTQDQGYENLQKLLLKIDQEFGTQGNRLYYLATHPSYFPTIIKKLNEHQLFYAVNSVDEKWSKVIVEKPLETIWILQCCCNTLFLNILTKAKCIVWIIILVKKGFKLFFH